MNARRVVSSKERVQPTLFFADVGRRKLTQPGDASLSCAKNR
jgi:hypothetical protein